MDRASKLATNLRMIIDRSADLVLIMVAISTLTLAIQMTYDLALDFINQEPHPLHYMVSEIMFVLIVMEIFRQVLRQIFRAPFSLNPFIAIGVIASVRGLLVTQMRLGVGDLDWRSGSLVMVAFAAVILMLMLAFFLYTKVSSPCPPNTTPDRNV